MAGGWAKDGAVSEQIEASISSLHGLSPARHCKARASHIVLIAKKKFLWPGNVRYRV